MLRPLASTKIRMKQCVRHTECRTLKFDNPMRALFDGSKHSSTNCNLMMENNQHSGGISALRCARLFSSIKYSKHVRARCLYIVESNSSERSDIVWVIASVSHFQSAEVE